MEGSLPAGELDTDGDGELNPSRELGHAMPPPLARAAQDMLAAARATARELLPGCCSHCTLTRGHGRGEHDLYSSSSHAGGASSVLVAMTLGPAAMASSTPVAMGSSAPTQAALASSSPAAMARGTDGGRTATREGEPAGAALGWDEPANTTPRTDERIRLLPASHRLSSFHFFYPQ